MWQEAVMNYDFEAHLSAGVKGNYANAELGYAANGMYVVCTERLSCKLGRMITT
jgi:hypothetical protein